MALDLTDEPSVVTRLVTPVISARDLRVWYGTTGARSGPSTGSASISLRARPWVWWGSPGAASRRSAAA